MLNLCRIWHMSPLELERIPPWLRSAMIEHTAREQEAERREARRAHRRG
jgi:hypothetical protein